MFKDNLDKAVQKPSGIPDWDSSLLSLWKDDIEREDGKQEQKRDWSIYSKEQSGHSWQGRTSVQERSR